jgi:tRNA(Ile)-lysidine synthase TilS/MesJ
MTSSRRYSTCFCRRAEGHAGAINLRQRPPRRHPAPVYVTEAEARDYCKERGLPIIGCCCPACGDLSLQRQRVKRLIVELEREHPNVKSSMIKALGNVMPRHLLDRRLNPLGDIAEEVAAEPTLIPLMMTRPS